MVDNTASQTDIKTINLTSGQTTATADYQLYASHEYTFLLWADDESYNAEDLTNITLKDNLSGTQAGLSYAAKATWDGSSPTITATLNHVASKVTLKATNKLEAGNTLTLTVPQAYSGYNVQDATITGEATTYPHTYTTTAVSGTQEQPVELFSFYVLAANALQNLTVSCNNETATVPANLGGGKHIVLKGDISTQEQPHSTSLSVSIAGWSDQELPFGGISQLDDNTTASASLQGEGTDTDPYRITSAADLKCYFNNKYTYAATGKYALLYTDIEINTSSGWEQINVYGTFDGGGHTISGTITNNDAEDLDFDSGSVGGLFKTVYGTVKNLEVSATINVSGENRNEAVNLNVGGIAGQVDDGGTITGCTYSGNLTVTARLEGEISIVRIGGIAGDNDGTVSYCTFSGKVDTSDAYVEGGAVNVGGIVGDGNEGTDCTNTGIVEE